MPKVVHERRWCWRHFEKLGLGSVKCKLCAKILKTAGNTTNMLGHLKAKHPLITASAAIENVSDNSGTEDENSNQSQDVPTTKTRRQISIEDSFSHALELAPYGEKCKKIDEAIIYMIVKDCQPYSIVEDEGFVNLMKTVAPRYEMPSRYKITCWVDTKYNILKEIWISNLKGRTITLTTDVWSDNMSMRSFLGLTAHFQMEMELVSLNIGVLELKERHTAEYLGETILKFCEDFNISKHMVTAVVTDNASNIVKAVEVAYGKNMHIKCFAHSLNLIARSSVQIPAIDNVIGKIKAIVTFFKQSSVASDLLRKHTDKILIQDVVTRWNSTYYMVERFMEEKDVINQVLISVPTQVTLLNGCELETASNILLVLKPLEEATNVLSGQKYCTASMVIPMVNILITKLKGLELSNVESKQCRNVVLSEIEKRMGAIEQVSILAMSTILDPRFKKIHFRDPLACAHAISKIKLLVKPTVNNKEDGENLQPKKDSFWEHHHTLAHQYRPSEDLDEEMGAYLRMPLAAFDSNPLIIWEGMRNTFPHLYEVAKKFVPVVGTSVPSERLFSQAASTLNYKRNRIKPERLNRLLFLHGIEKKFWI